MSFGVKSLRELLEDKQEKSSAVSIGEAAPPPKTVALPPKIAAAASAIANPAREVRAPVKKMPAPNLIAATTVLPLQSGQRVEGTLPAKAVAKRARVGSAPTPSSPPRRRAVLPPDEPVIDASISKAEQAKSPPPALPQSGVVVRQSSMTKDEEKSIIFAKPAPVVVVRRGAFSDELEWASSIVSAHASGIIPELNSRPCDQFSRICQVGEGSHGVVYKARDRKTNEIRALKRIKLIPRHKGLPAPALREIQILASFQHPNIVEMLGVAVGESSEKNFCVLEYVDHDLGELMNLYPRAFLDEGFIKRISEQVVQGLTYLHEEVKYIHRDIKPSNLLYSKAGIVKICDFGLAIRESAKRLLVAGTRWYRAPELVLGSSKYDSSIDIWAFGCIIVEMILQKPIFKVVNDTAHVALMHDVLGVPNDANFVSRKELPKWDEFESIFCRLENEPGEKTLDEIISVVSQQGRLFIKSLLHYDANRRPKALAAKLHSWFSNAPLPFSANQLPQFDESKKVDYARGKRQRNKKKRAELEKNEIFV